MNKSLLTIQFNTNSWQLGMAYEAHAFRKSQLGSEKSFFFLVAGMNNHILGDLPFHYRLRHLSTNLYSLKRLNHELEDNYYEDKSVYSRTFMNRNPSRFQKMTYKEILENAHENMGIDEKKANQAVKLAIIDKFKLWRLESIDQLPIAKDYLIGYLSTYSLVNRLINDYDIGFLNVFNSRFLNEGAAKNAALANGVQVTEFEQVNSRADSFGLFDSRVHDPLERATMARDAFKMLGRVTSIQDLTFTDKWISLRRKGVLQKFTKNQEIGTVPIFPKGKKLLSCFLSSFDELILAGYISEEFSFNQSNCLGIFSDLINQRDDWHLVIREHPNMLTRGKSEQDFWRVLLSEVSAQVITAKDKIDSYAIIEESDLVLTFGSTIAVEALALGVPSILMGDALYSGHRIVPQITHPKDLELFLDNPPTITQATKNELEKYCYFQLYGGIRFKRLGVKNESEYAFNPALYFQGRKVICSEKGLASLTRFYSRIQDLKKFLNACTSNFLCKSGCSK